MDGDAGLGLLLGELEVDALAGQLGEDHAGADLLGVVLAHALLLAHAGELDGLLDLAAGLGLAGGAALGHGLGGEAELVGLLDDLVLVAGALAGLGLEGLDHLEER